MNTVHVKSQAASTLLEVQNLRDHELIKSPSKDKRWAIRESSARISRFYLMSPVREPEDENWGPTWSEMLSANPAPKVLLDNSSIDLPQ